MYALTTYCIFINPRNNVTEFEYVRTIKNVLLQDSAHNKEEDSPEIHKVYPIIFENTTSDIPTEAQIVQVS